MKATPKILMAITASILGLTSSVTFAGPVVWNLNMNGYTISGEDIIDQSGNVFGEVLQITNNGTNSTIYNSATQSGPTATFYTFDVLQSAAGSAAVTGANTMTYTNAAQQLDFYVQHTDILPTLLPSTLTTTQATNLVDSGNNQWLFLNVAAGEQTNFTGYTPTSNACLSSPGSKNALDPNCYGGLAENGAKGSITSIAVNNTGLTIAANTMSYSFTAIENYAGSAPGTQTQNALYPFFGQSGNNLNLIGQVPEPTALTLLGAGFLGIGAIRRKANRA